MPRPRKLTHEQVVYIRDQWDCLRHPTRQLAKELGVTPQVASRVYDELMPGDFFSKDGRFDPDILKAMSESFVEMKLLDHAADLSKYVTNSFLPRP